MKNKKLWLTVSLNTVLPALFTVLLFGYVSIFVTIPFIEKSLLSSKNQIVQTQVMTVLSILKNYEQKEINGELTKEAAQFAAKELIRGIRYGNEEYIFICDLNYTSIMHPLRKHLEGTSMELIRDSEGKYFVKELIDLAKSVGSGYVNYMWYHKKDKNIRVPKVAFVHSFEPWGWIIGSGVDIDDAKAEIRSNTNDTIIINVSIISLTLILSLFIIVRSVSAVKKQLISQKALEESENKYRNLFDSLNDAVFVEIPKNKQTPGKFIQVNDFACELLGYSKEELLNLSPLDIVQPNFDESSPTKEVLESIHQTLSSYVELTLIKKDGTTIPAELNIKLCEQDGKKTIITVVRDTSKRKEAERTLYESEKKFRILYETMIQGVIYHDLEGKVIDANPAVQKMLDFSLNELKGKAFADFNWSIIREDGEEFPTAEYPHVVALRVGAPVSNVVMGIKKAGSYKTIWINVNAIPQYYITGMPHLVYTTIEDITERKFTNDKLKLSKLEIDNKNSMLTALLDTLPIGVVMVEAGTGNSLIANDTAFRMLGTGIMADSKAQNPVHVYPKFKEQSGKPYPLDEIPTYQALDGRKSQVDDMLIIHPDGSKHLFEVIGTPLIDSNKKVWASLTSYRDITEKKEMENAISAEKERLAVTLRSIGDGVITTDIEGKVLLINKVAEELTEWKQEDAVGKNLSQVFKIINETTRECCENPVNKVINTGNIIELANHTLLISKNGLERIIADSAAPIKNENSETIGVVLVFRDMTEKQKLLETSQNNQKLESLGVLAGGIAHDFNNLLGGIFGNIDLAYYLCKETEVGEYLNKALNTIERAKGLTMQLLTFSKGGAPIQKVAPLFPFLKETIQFALSGSNAACNYNIENDLWLCYYDKNQIGQVIDNLIINACQAMPDGGNIEVEVKNVVLKENEHPTLSLGQYVKISIVDNGVGIPPESINRIFDPFYTTKTNGQGLGLATSFSIINRHNGCIEVESEIGKGATFNIYLPAVFEASSVETKESNLQFQGNGNVLIMDDEKVIRDTVRDMLSVLGFNAVCLSNGEELLDYFSNEKKLGNSIAAIIVDLTIPGSKGGMEVINEIRQLDKTIPVFVASGYSQNQIMGNPELHGFTASISKPFRIKELTDMLNTFLK